MDGGDEATKVFLLDDDEDLRGSVGELIAAVSGGDCVTAASVPEMMARTPEVLACQLALLDINLGAGKPTGVDAYHWLRAQGFRGRICFVTGHAHAHPLVK